MMPNYLRGVKEHFRPLTAPPDQGSCHSHMGNVDHICRQDGRLYIPAFVENLVFYITKTAFTVSASETINAVHPRDMLTCRVTNCMFPLTM